MAEILVHKHLIIRAEINNPPTDPEWCKQWVRDVIHKLGMKVCAGPVAAYVDTIGNAGVTVAGILETSHMVMHIWDEPSPALCQLDVYTCGEFNTSIIFDELDQFDPVKIEHKFLDREFGLVEIELD